MEYGTLDSQMLAYLWMAVEHGKSILVAGATAAGKTTLLNSISLFIRPELKIVSIEDTPELRLPHPNWVPETAREGFGFGEQQTGSVSLDDLLKESLRQRPDYIIVGEVRGEEAYILFQQIATGHPGMATLHASSMEKIMDRLTTKPIDLPPSLIENLDLIVFAKRTRRQGTYLRRVDSIYEFEGYDKESDQPLVNRLFKWQAANDDFGSASGSSILAEIAEEQGVEIREVQEELMRRKKILEWMQEQGIKHYKDVGRIISTYYHHPSQIMERLEAEY
jgi:flagellar protein FlaI